MLLESEKAIEEMEKPRKEKVRQMPRCPENYCFEDGV